MSLRSLVMAIVAVLVMTTASIAPAQTGEFPRRHPRRAQVNRRERRQDQRIDRGVKSGKISPEEAAKLEQEQTAIKQKERAEVKANGGHLTKGQQRELNQELNDTSKEIYRDKRN